MKCCTRARQLEAVPTLLLLVLAPWLQERYSFQLVGNWLGSFQLCLCCSLESSISVVPGSSTAPHWLEAAPAAKKQEAREKWQQQHGHNPRSLASVEPPLQLEIVLITHPREQGIAKSDAGAPSCLGQARAGQSLLVLMCYGSHQICAGLEPGCSEPWLEKLASPWTGCLPKMHSVLTRCQETENLPPPLNVLKKRLPNFHSEPFWLQLLALSSYQVLSVPIFFSERLYYNWAPGPRIATQTRIGLHAMDLTCRTTDP